MSMHKSCPGHADTLFLTMKNPILMTKHIRIIIRGVKRNSGNRFRTFFMAKQLGLPGLVREDQEHLIIEAEGPEEKLNELIWYVEREHPGLSKQVIEVAGKPKEFFDEFMIL